MEKSRFISGVGNSLCWLYALYICRVCKQDVVWCIKITRSRKEPLGKGGRGIRLPPNTFQLPLRILYSTARTPSSAPAAPTQSHRYFTSGSLREYIGHFRYKWLNYYVRMSKNVVWDPHERFPLGFSRWPHSVGGAECGRHSKPREKRSWGSQTTFPSSSDGRTSALGGTPAA